MQPPTGDFQTELEGLDTMLAVYADSKAALLSAFGGEPSVEAIVSHMIDHHLDRLAADRDTLRALLAPMLLVVIGSITARAAAADRSSPPLH